MDGEGGGVEGEGGREGGRRGKQGQLPINVMNLRLTRAHFSAEENCCAEGCAKISLCVMVSLIRVWLYDN